MDRRNPQQKFYGASMLENLKRFFGMDYKKKPSGNRAMPPHLQQETQARAQAKRERKLDRPQGWYNG